MGVRLDAVVRVHWDLLSGRAERRGWGGLLVLPWKLAGMRERECYLGATVGAGMGGQGTTMTGQWAWRASQPGTEPASWCQRWPGAPMTRASALK